MYVISTVQQVKLILSWTCEAIMTDNGWTTSSFDYVKWYVSLFLVEPL